MPSVSLVKDVSLGPDFWSGLGAMETNKVKNSKLFFPSLPPKTSRGSLPSPRELILSEWPGDYLRLLSRPLTSPFSTFSGRGGFTKDPESLTQSSKSHLVWIVSVLGRGR